MDYLYLEGNAVEKKRILLLSQPNLLRDSLEHILGALEDVQVTGTWPLEGDVLAHCAAQSYDLVLIADDEASSPQASAVMSSLLETHPQVPIVRVRLDPGVLLVAVSQARPARVADLIQIIRQGTSK